MSRYLTLCLFVLLPNAGQSQPAEIPAKYAEAVRVLEKFVAAEVEQKRLPALSIALVDDQQLIWSKGFGHIDLGKTRPATAETVYRVGSVSKLFTDIAVMQLVEKGVLDLDAPVSTYLPDFKPKNQFDKPITLRMLMAHRSGLIREPSVGSYFHDDEPTLRKMVESLNGVPLVYEPESKIKYSNAAIATVGYVLEVTQKTPFPKYVQEHVLTPLGFTKSSFALTDPITKDLAEALMWSYQGREFKAPTFELGEGPAGCMYSTVNDLARFLSVMFADGKTVKGEILKPETLKQMLTPQFPKKDEKGGFGIGFSIGELAGQRRIGHGGAIYGFSTDLAFLPDSKVGVVVVASRDVANSAVTRIADDALRQLLAVKQGKELPGIATTTPLNIVEAKKLAGRYQSGEKVLQLIESAGRLWMLPKRGGFRVEVRREGDHLLTDDNTGFGTRIELDGEKLRIGKDEYVRTRDEKPKPFSSDLIGEYGWDHNVLYIFEWEGQLYCNIEWFFVYPLKEEKNDVYSFPLDFGLYHGEKLLFKRNGQGKVTEVEAASVTFKRRKVDGEDGQTFRIQPLKPVAELTKAALADKPPVEKGEFLKPDLVELAKLDPTIQFDLRYATDNNFLSVPLYPKTAKAYMQKPAAEALVRVNAKLKEDGYGLLIFDSYRPWYVTKIFYEATPEKFRNFVADPSKGSRHNRGCAVDLGLYDLKTGKVVEVVSGFDEFSDRAFPDYLGGTSLQRWHRDLLRKRMENEGFTVYPEEWWHFDFSEWKKYPIGNQTFEELEGKK